MGGMPVFEFGNWLHQTTAFYTMAIPFFFYLNNFVGPKALEPDFCRDYLMAQFDKMANLKPSAGAASAAYTPTPGKVPVVPLKNMFARGPRPVRTVASMASLGLLALVQPKRQ